MFEDVIIQILNVVWLAKTDLTPLSNSWKCSPCYSRWHLHFCHPYIWL